MPFVVPRGATVPPQPNPVNIVNAFSNASGSSLSHQGGTFTDTNKLQPRKINFSAEPTILQPNFKLVNQWVRTADNAHYLFTKTWQPLHVPLAAVLVYVHDIAEHCERYGPMFRRIAMAGVEVQSYDQPGFGETGARANAQGITGGYDCLLAEIDAAVQRAKDLHPKKAIFLMGHGMGGALVLNYVCSDDHKRWLLAGVLVSSPYLKPTLNGSGAKFPTLYKNAARWYPNVQVQFPIIASELTDDEVEQERHQADGLILQSVSLKCLAEMVYNGQKVLTKRWKKYPMALPMWLGHGTLDPICSFSATTKLYNNLREREPAPVSLRFRNWRGYKHDPHWDEDAHQIQNEYAEWIKTVARYYTRPPLWKQENDMIKPVEPTASGASKGKDKAADTIDVNQGSFAPPFNDSDKSPSKRPDPSQGVEQVQDLDSLRQMLEEEKRKAQERRQQYQLEISGCEESVEKSIQDATAEINRNDQCESLDKESDFDSDESSQHSTSSLASPLSPSLIPRTDAEGNALSTSNPPQDSVAKGQLLSGTSLAKLAATVPLPASPAMESRTVMTAALVSETTRFMMISSSDSPATPHSVDPIVFAKNVASPMSTIVETEIQLEHPPALVLSESASMSMEQAHETVRIDTPTTNISNKNDLQDTTSAPTGNDNVQHERKNTGATIGVLAVASDIVKETIPEPNSETTLAALTIGLTSQTTAAIEASVDPRVPAQAIEATEPALPNTGNFSQEQQTLSLEAQHQLQHVPQTQLQHPTQHQEQREADKVTSKSKKRFSLFSKLNKKK